MNCKSLYCFEGFWGNSLTGNSSGGVSHLASGFLFNGPFLLAPVLSSPAGYLSSYSLLCFQTGLSHSKLLGGFLALPLSCLTPFLFSYFFHPSLLYVFEPSYPQYIPSLSLFGTVSPSNPFLLSWIFKVKSLCSQMLIPSRHALIDTLQT